LFAIVLLPYQHTHWLAPSAASNVATSKTARQPKTLPATLSVAKDACSAGSTVYELSNDGGATWSVVTPGTAHAFAQAGSNLMWRASLSNNANPGESPTDSPIAATQAQSPSTA
jgi:hypothetical protein